MMKKNLLWMAAALWVAYSVSSASASQVTISPDSGKNSCIITVPSGSTVINRWTVRFPDGSTHTYHGCSTGMTSVAPYLGIAALAFSGLGVTRIRQNHYQRR